MKKILAILLIALSVFAFTGCGSDEPKSYTANYIAYVNYFGEIKKYEIATYSISSDNNIIKLTLKNGSRIVVGQNNVIIEDK